MKEKSSDINLPFFSCPRRKKSRILLFPVAFPPFCTVAGRKEPCDTNSYQKELYNIWEQTQKPQKLTDFGTDALLHELCILLDNSRKQKPGMLNPLIDPLKIAAGQHPERKASAFRVLVSILKISMRKLPFSLFWFFRLQDSASSAWLAKNTRKNHKNETVYPA